MVNYLVRTLIHQTTTVMHYSQIIYKTYVITKGTGYWSWRAESSAREDVTHGISYEDLIEWIDLLWDGKEPEGYFNRY